MEFKQRHGLLTFWLVLMLIGNASSAYLNAVAIPNGSIPKLPNVADWTYYALAVASLFNIVCTIALFQWKKWGFFGFLASAIFALLMNLFVAKIGLLSSLPGLLGVVLLYGVLHVGNENKGWPQLD